MLAKRLIKSNDAGGGVCQSDITDIFGDGSGVALYQLNWDGSDMSGNYDGVTTDVSFVNGKIDSAGSFNGSSSQVSIPATSTTPVDFSQESFSISMWVKPSSIGVENIFLAKYSIGSDSPSTKRSIIIRSLVGGQIDVVEHNGAGIFTQTTTATISANNYSFITYTRTATTGNIYINNNSVESLSKSNTIKDGSTQPIILGNENSGGNYFNGDIDQVRTFNKAISASEVTTLYNEVACEKTCTTDTPQLVSDCIAYYKLDGNADDALNTYDGTPSNVSWTQGRFGSAAKFNGSNAIIDTPIIPITNTSSFTVSSWVNVTSLSLGNIIPFAQTTTSESNTFISIGVRPSSNNIELVREGSDGVGLVVYEPYTWTAGWHNVVWVCTSTNSKVYVDNVLVGNTNFTQNTNYSVNTQSIGGRLRPAQMLYAEGVIDQVRIYDRAITATEVTTLYNEVACPSGASFNTVLYTADGTITPVGGVGFQPDFVWIKGRTLGSNHQLTDSVRQAPKSLMTNRTDAEASRGVSSFNTDGFTLQVWPNENGDSNTSGDDYVAWCWKAGGDAVTNTDGVTSGSVTAVTSEVSANVDAGFSIAKFTSPASGKPSWGHGLNASPDFIMVKRLDASQSWFIYLPSVLGQKELRFTTAAATTYPQFLSVDSSKIDLGSASFNISSNADYISYCFHSVAGFSKIGSYTGGSTPNKQTTGFEPAFVLTKSTTNAAAGWNIFDNKRGTNKRLHPNLSNSESIDGPPAIINFLSDGFSFNTQDAWNNGSHTYIYMAFANEF